MALTSRKRKLLLGAGILLAAMVVLILAMPIWLPWVLRPVLQKNNVTFTAYERQGYSRFVLADITFATNGVKFAAERVELFQPVAWLWKKQFRIAPGANFATVSGWRLEISKTPDSTNSLPTILDKTDAVLPHIKSWLSTAAATNGVIQSGTNAFTVPSITWDRGLLRATARSDRYRQTAELEAWFSTEPKQLRLKLPEAELEADLEVRRQNSADEIGGLIQWRTNRIEISAEFPERRDAETTRLTLFERWMPGKASLRSEQFRVPASLLKLEGYQDLTGSASVIWDGKQFEIDLTGEAKPERSLPPLTTVVHARGSTNLLHIEQAKIISSWFRAELSENVKLDFSGKLLTPEARLKVFIDLDQQRFIKASGRFSGEALLSRSEKNYPKTTFQLRAAEFEGFDIHAREIELAGKLDWPLLNVQKLQARMADGGMVEANGQADLVQREIAKARLMLEGNFGHGFLPPEISYTNFTLTADLLGPFKQPAHSGKMEIRGLVVSNVSPLTMTANWRGKYLNFDQLELKATAKRSSLALTASGNIDKEKSSLNLSALTLTKLGQAMMALKQPANISLQMLASTNAGARWQMDVGKIFWQGANRELSIEGSFTLPAQAHLNGSARQINAFLFQDFLVKPPPNVGIDELHFSGGWTNGPLDFVLRGHGEYRADETNIFEAKILASGDEAGLSFEEVSVLSDSAPIVSGRGFIPIRIQPARTNRIDLRLKEIVDIRAEILPHPSFWNRIADLIHVRFTEPKIHAVISGSLEKPQGTISASAAGAEWLNAKQELPAIKNIRVEIGLNERKITVNQFTLLAEGQPFSAEAELPMAEDFLKNWKQTFDWRKASGRIFTGDIELAPFVRFAPKILASQGKFSLNAAFSPGLQFSGGMKVVNASTQPISGIGSLHELNVAAVFKGRRLELEGANGLLGGQPIGVFGSIDFGEMKGALPLIDLRLAGRNVPLARAPENILRGDLELKLSNRTNTVPIVSGEVNLRDSFYLGDVRQLLPGRVASPEKRPPYFSLQAKPLADWRLNIRVGGTNFMRVRSPLFNGSVTAALQIGGTLQEPMALGDVKIESGVVQFPFANFRITHGFVSLISDDPYRPRLFITAASRAYGYDLLMTLNGPADEPVVEFSSSPPLTSEQIILMVTAGEVPRKEFGFSNEKKAQKLAMFLGKSLLSRFSTDEAGAERLTIRSGEDISEEGRETYSAEYKLSDKWSIVVDYDRFGALNAGVKWRVYSK